MGNSDILIRSENDLAHFVVRSHDTPVVDDLGESLDKSFALLNGLTFACTTGVWCLPIPHKCQRIFRLGHVVHEAQGPDQDV